MLLNRIRAHALEVIEFLQKHDFNQFFITESLGFQWAKGLEGKLKDEYIEVP